MAVPSEKEAVKFFKKRLNSTFFEIGFYGCPRILVQSMMQIIKKIFFLYASFPNELFVICYKFDMAEFYPSASEELLDKAINYAKWYTDICDNVITAIKLARKSLLFNEETAWVKKGGKTFDVTMGSYDGAEICELVGLYLLDKPSGILDKIDRVLIQ